MSRRVFALVKRKGNMDETAVCVFPWELPILQLIHGQEIKEATIESMSTFGKAQGVVKIQKEKLKYRGEGAPSIKDQLEIMAYVDPDEDPALDPATEWNRMVEKYGMDTEMPVPVVERVYGQMEGGRWEKALREAAKERSTKPVYLKAIDEGMGKPPKQMTVAELRDELDKRGVTWVPKQKKEELITLLEAEMVE